MNKKCLPIQTNYSYRWRKCLLLLNSTRFWNW